MELEFEALLSDKQKATKILYLCRPNKSTILKQISRSAFLTDNIYFVKLLTNSSKGSAQGSSGRTSGVHEPMGGVTDTLEDVDAGDGPYLLEGGVTSTLEDARAVQPEGAGSKGA